MRRRPPEKGGCRQNWRPHKTGGVMCPVCVTNYLTTAALVASSTGGLAAVVVKKLGLKKTKLKENRNAATQNRV